VDTTDTNYESSGGAPPPGRDASRFTTDASAATIGTAPVAMAINPLGSLSEHTVRIMNDDSSNLSFNVDVHLILAPGDEPIGIGDKIGYACESSRQETRRSLSEITGNPYFPTPRPDAYVSGDNSYNSAKGK
jgi:hypothetical protein